MTMITNAKLIVRKDGSGYLATKDEKTGVYHRPAWVNKQRKGWVGESTRHSMSAYGIKTGRKEKVHKRDYFTERDYLWAKYQDKMGIKRKYLLPSEKARIKEQTETELRELNYDDDKIDDFMNNDFQNTLSVDENVKHFKKIKWGR